MHSRLSGIHKRLLLVLAALMAGWGVFNGVVIPPTDFTGFDMAPPSLAEVAAFEHRWFYALLHAVSLLPVIALSFDRKVHFHTSWRDLIPAIVIIGAAFIAWDVVFTSWKIWGFNHHYISGLKVAGLPWEEWLFFFTVPFACLFIYECLNAYIGRDLLGGIQHALTIGLIVLFGVLGLVLYDRIYSATTFLLTAAFLLVHLLYLPGTWRGRFYLAWLVSWIPFLLIDGALTGSFTLEPIVLYHPPEFSGWRIVSIPVEDSVYSLLLLMSITTIYEHKKEQRKKRSKKVS